MEKITVTIDRKLWRSEQIRESVRQNLVNQYIGWYGEKPENYIITSEEGPGDQLIITLVLKKIKKDKDGK